MRHHVFQCLLTVGGGVLLVLTVTHFARAMTSQNLPAEALPTATAASAPSPGSPSSANEEPPGTGPNGASIIATPGEGAGASDNLGNDSTASPDSDRLAVPAGAQPSVTPAVQPPPAIDASTISIGPNVGNASLEPEIDKPLSPALAASLRLTEAAREDLASGQIDDALRELARAVSIDPSDAFSYYYLGRSYLLKKNYRQALIFFTRAEIGFRGRPQWTGEALGYEGVCDEELGESNRALKAYRRALAASPDNLMARVGYGRLAPMAVGAPGALDAPPPVQDLSLPPPQTQAPSAAAPQSPMGAPPAD